MTFVVFRNTSSQVKKVKKKNREQTNIFMLEVMPLRTTDNTPHAKIVQLKKVLVSYVEILLEINTKAHLYVFCVNRRHRDFRQVLLVLQFVIHLKMYVSINRLNLKPICHHSILMFTFDGDI